MQVVGLYGSLEETPFSVGDTLLFLVAGKEES